MFWRKSKTFYVDVTGALRDCYDSGKYLKVRWFVVHKIPVKYISSLYNLTGYLGLLYVMYC